MWGGVMRLRYSSVAAILVFAAAATFGQGPVITDAQRAANRGLVRSGKIGGPAFDPNNPLPTRVISFDDFKRIKWPRGTNPKFFPSAVGQHARVAAEESVIYQIDNLDMVGFNTCNRGGSIEFIPFDSSILSSPIIGGWPKVKCLAGSKYADAIDLFVARYSQRYSVWAPADPFGCVGGGEHERNHRPLRVMGVGFWDDNGGATTPVLTLNPILYMTELDENGQPIDPGTVVMPINHGPRTQAKYTLSFAVSGPSFTPGRSVSFG